jgi:hypothetical protein
MLPPARREAENRFVLTAPMAQGACDALSGTELLVFSIARARSPTDAF